MSDRAFTMAVRALAEDAPVDARVAAIFVGLFGATGTTVSTLGDVFGAETVSAFDTAAGNLSELQIDLGEGPLWDAHDTAAPVLRPHLAQTTENAWPLAAEGLLARGAKSVFAFPLHVGDLRIGALALYGSEPMVLSPTQLEQMRTLTDLLSRRLLRRALEPGGSGGQLHDGGYDRREVHQATGMVIAQMRLAPGDALMVLRAHAFAHGRLVRDVATDVIQRALDFTPTPN